MTRRVPLPEGIHGPGITLSVRAAAWIDAETDFAGRLNAARGSLDPEILRDLTRVKVAARYVIEVTSADGTPKPPSTEPVGELTRWISTKEAAEILGVTPRRVTDLARDQQLVAQKILRHWWIDKSSINRRNKSAE